MRAPAKKGKPVADAIQNDSHCTSLVYDEWSNSNISETEQKM